MKKLSLALLLFLFAKPLSAQQGETLLNGFSLVAPFKAAAGTDHNFLIDRPTENSDPAAAPGLSPKRVNDSIMLLTLPKIAYQNDSRRHQFVATWVPEFELFHHNTDQDAINQQALGSFAYSLKRNLQFSLGDTYTASSDPSRVLSNVFVLLPRSRFHENDFRGTIDYQPNQVTSIGIRYDQSYTRFGEAEPLQVRMLDSSIHGYSLLVSRMLAPNKRIRATYSYFKVARLNRGIGDDVDVDTSRRLGRPMHSASLEYRWGVNPNTLLGLSGGLIRLDTGLNYTVRSSIDRRLGNFWIGGGYSRSLSFQTRAHCAAP